jgi:hypothetical protein
MVQLHFVAMTEEQAKQVTVVTYSTWLIWCARVQMGEEIRLFLAQTLLGFWLPIAPHCLSLISGLLVAPLGEQSARASARGRLINPYSGFWFLLFYHAMPCRTGIVSASTRFMQYFRIVSSFK